MFQTYMRHGSSRNICVMTSDWNKLIDRHSMATDVQSKQSYNHRIVPKAVLMEGDMKG